MATTNSQITEVDPSQSDKVTTINAAFEQLDNLINAATDIAVTADFLLTDTEQNNAIAFNLTGTPGVAFTMALQARSKLFIVINGTGSTCTVEVDPDEDGADGDTVDVEDGEAFILFSDGTNVTAVGGGSSSGGSSSSLVDWKDSVRVATTAAGTLASDFENGDTVDGVTLATSDRILIKDQSDGSENGVYVVQASGSPVRADDFDEDSEVTTGAAMIIEEGTTNAGTLQVLTTTGTITVGTTALTFTELSGSGGGSSGVDIEEDDSSVATGVDTINFEGNVEVTDDGSGKVTVNVTSSGSSAEATFTDYGHMAPLQPPTTTDFSTSFTTTVAPTTSISDSEVGLIMNATGGGSDNIWEGRVKSWTPAVETHIFRMFLNVGTDRFPGGGLIIRDSSSGNFVAFGAQGLNNGDDVGWYADNFDAGGFDSNAISNPALIGNFQSTWVKIDTTATGATMSVSFDAVNWFEAGSITFADHVASPDQIGFGVKGTSDADGDTNLLYTFYSDDGSVTVDRTISTSLALDIKDETGTSYTTILGDADTTYIRQTNASAITTTIPANSSVAYPLGTTLTFEQGGAGVITLTPDTGVTLNSRGSLLDTAGQYAVVSCVKTDTDTWTVTGDLA